MTKPETNQHSTGSHGKGLARIQGLQVSIQIDHEASKLCSCLSYPNTCKLFVNYPDNRDMLALL